MCAYRYDISYIILKLVSFYQSLYASVVKTNIVPPYHHTKQIIWVNPKNNILGNKERHQQRCYQHHFQQQYRQVKKAVSITDGFV